ncbi:hypothetical protein C4J95_2305 [Pseudomonas orientalis]|nr:hypothetical protein C4J96_2208 [Pseudomonas orientalis]AZE99767.1 hypothetical protein C4J95_2305 [Pseudomonas orientalis]
MKVPVRTRFEPDSSGEVNLAAKFVAQTFAQAVPTLFNSLNRLEKV